MARDADSGEDVIEQPLPAVWRGDAAGSLNVLCSKNGLVAAIGGLHPASVLVLEGCSSLRTKKQLVDCKPGHQADLRVAEFTSSGTHLVAGGDDGSIRWWSLDSGQLLSACKFPPQLRERGPEEPPAPCPIAFLTCSNSSNMVAAASGRLICVFGPGGEHLHSIPKAQHPVAGLAWLDSSRLVAASGSSLLVWRVTPDSCCQAQPHKTQLQTEIAGLSCSPDGRRLAAECSDSTVQVWDASLLGSTATSSPLVLGQRGDARATSLTWHSSSRYLAYACRGTVVIWDLEDVGLQSVFSLDMKCSAASAAFQANGSLLAIANDSGYILFFNVRRLASGQVDIRRMGFTRLVSVSRDQLGHAVRLIWHPSGLLAAGEPGELVCFDAASLDGLSPAHFREVDADEPGCSSPSSAAAGDLTKSMAMLLRSTAVDHSSGASPSGPLESTPWHRNGGGEAPVCRQQSAVEAKGGAEFGRVGRAAVDGGMSGGGTGCAGGGGGTERVSPTAERTSESYSGVPLTPDCDALGGSTSTTAEAATAGGCDNGGGDNGPSDVTPTKLQPPVRGEQTKGHRLLNGHEKTSECLHDVTPGDDLRNGGSVSTSSSKAKSPVSSSSNAKSPGGAGRRPNGGGGGGGSARHQASAAQQQQQQSALAQLNAVAQQPPKAQVPPLGWGMMPPMPHWPLSYMPYGQMPTMPGMPYMMGPSANMPMTYPYLPVGAAPGSPGFMLPSAMLSPAGVPPAMPMFMYPHAPSPAPWSAAGLATAQQQQWPATVPIYAAARSQKACPKAASSTQSSRKHRGSSSSGDPHSTSHTTGVTHTTAHTTENGMGLRLDSSETASTETASTSGTFGLGASRHCQQPNSVGSSGVQAASSGGASGEDRGTRHVATLYIGNLAPTVEERSLYDTFIQFGLITNVQIIRLPCGTSKGYGFVSFKHLGSATMAIQLLNGVNLMSVFQGRAIKVSRYTKLHCRDIDRSAVMWPAQQQHHPQVQLRTPKVLEA